MAISSLKLLLSVLQIRSLTTQASKILKPTPKLAAVPKPNSKSKKASLILDKQYESVESLLKTHQFSDTQISILAQSHPSTFRLRVANLEPKFKFFVENGFNPTHLAECIMKNPLILCRSLNSHLIPMLEYLKTHVGEIDDMTLMMVLTRASKSLQPNIELLIKEGVPICSILLLLKYQPRCLLNSVDRITTGIQRVKKFGVDPTQNMFIHVLRLLLSRSDSYLNNKFKVMKSLGWSDEDIVSTIVRQPVCLMCSEDKLRRAMEYLVKTMKLDPKMVISNPRLVMFSLEKRTIPRCKVLLVLQEKKLLSEGSLHSSMNKSEADFVRFYVLKYLNEVPRLLDLYRGWKMDGVAANQQ